jgi:hypothetical protein
VSPVSLLAGHMAGRLMPLQSADVILHTVLTSVPAVTSVRCPLRHDFQL